MTTATAPAFTIDAIVTTLDDWTATFRPRFGRYWAEHSGESDGSIVVGFSDNRDAERLALMLRSGTTGLRHAGYDAEAEFLGDHLHRVRVRPPATATPPAPPAPRLPGVHYYDGHTPDEWAAFIDAMHSGDAVEIDVSMYWYWLEVLPPATMRETYDFPDGPVRSQFGFAEGWDYITAFWKAEGRYFCRRTTVMNRG